MKKIISIALVIIMIVLAVPFSAFAAVKSEAAVGDKISSGVATVVYTKDGSETELGTYDTLDAAFEALRELYLKPLMDPKVKNDEELYVAAGSPVIKLNGNFDGAFTSPDWVVPSSANNLKAYNANKVITFVIDGAKSATENYTISYGTVTAFQDMAHYNLTIKNTNLVFSGANGDNNFFWGGRTVLAGKSTVTFENCLIDQNSSQAAGSDSGSLFKLGGFKGAEGNVDVAPGDKFDLIFKDCTIFSATAVGLQIHWGADSDVSLINTTWTLDGHAGTANNNDCILKAYNNGKVSFNIDGTSKLISARAEGAKTTTLIRTLNTSGGDITVNLEAGAELIMNNTATSSLTSQTYISLATNRHATTINDKGATFKANAASQKLGVTLPTGITDEYGTPHTWTANGAAVANPYKNADASADITFTHSAPDESIYDETDSSIAYVEISGGKKFYFDTLQKAADHLGTLYARVTTKGITDEALWEAAGSPVIVLYKDIELNATVEPNWWSKNYDVNRVRTVIVKGVKSDGSQVKITSNVKGAAFRYNAYYNLTLENINLDCANGFAIFWSGYSGAKNSGKSTTTVKNCTIRAAGTDGSSGGEGLVFKVTGNQNQTKTENYIINLIGTTVNAIAGTGADGSDQDGVNAVFLFHHGCAGTLNIDGTSKINHYNRRESAGGDTMFMLGTNRKFVINIESGAELLGRAMDTNSSGAYKNTYAIFRLEGSDTYPSVDGIKNVINIKSGAKITLDTNGPAFTGNTYFFWNDLADTTKSIYNIEAGANLVFTAKAAALGGGLIGGTADYCGGTAIAYAINDGTTKTYSTVATFAKGTYNSEVSITPVLLNDMFSTSAGAAIMMKDGKGAIRFQTNVSKELLEVLKGTELTFGTIVVLKSVMAPDLSPIPDRTYVGGQAGIELVSTQSKWIETEDGYVYYTALADIDATAQNFITELAFCSYIRVKNSDGTMKTIYAEYDEDLHVRSMYEIATNLETAGNGTDASQTVIDTVTAAMN